MIEQRSPEWFAQRRGRVTGSVAGAILGVSPFMSANDVMRQMVRDYHNLPSEIPDNPAFAYGRFHETLAIRDFEMQYHKVEPCGFFAYEDWLGASPDGLVNDDAVIEVKCPYKYRTKNPEFLTLAMQPHYYAQVQLEMLCTGRQRAWFYQWSPIGDQVEVVLRDQAWLDVNLPRLRAFYDQYLIERENPDKYILKHIDTLYVNKLLDEYDELKEAEDRAVERKKAIIKEFEIITGGESAILGENRKFTKVERAGQVAYAKACKDYKINVEPYRGKPSEYWKLT